MKKIKGLWDSLRRYRVFIQLIHLDDGTNKAWSYECTSWILGKEQYPGQHGRYSLYSSKDTTRLRIAGLRDAVKRYSERGIKYAPINKWEEQQLEKIKQKGYDSFVREEKS